jgi:hypothetical protein
VFWDISDEAGRAVLTGRHGEVVAILRPGRYVVAAATRDKRYQRQIRLEAGDSKLVEVSPD